MSNGLNEWMQDGRLYVWRYDTPGRGWRGWHFAADAASCRSVANLLNRMRGGEPCHRTLRLESVTDEILRVPNYNHATAGSFEKLRVCYAPDFENLEISPEKGDLVMTVGNRRIGKLSSAFNQVEIGNGDFCIVASDIRNADPWMFWWIPKSLVHYGKQT